MHVTDPSAVLGSLLLLSGVIFTALSGRRERERQRAYEEVQKTAELARQEAKEYAELARQEAKEHAEQEIADEEKTYRRLQSDYLRVTGDCDRCERRLQMCQESLSGRDAYWDKHRTTYLEVAGLIAVPGAVPVLRKYRDLRASEGAALAFLDDGRAENDSENNKNDSENNKNDSENNSGDNPQTTGDNA